MIARPAGFRFHPPAVAVPADWFCRLRKDLPRPEWTGVGDAEGGALVVGRRPSRSTRRLSVVRSIQLSELLQHLSRVAIHRGTKIVLLKGVALLEGKYVEPWDRPFADIDILAPKSDAAGLMTKLVELGFFSYGHGEDHHLPPLHHKKFGTVEIHTSIPGMQDDGANPITVDTLLQRRFCDPLPRLERVYIPVPTFLAAHALVHGMDQHGFTPHTYPFLRTFTDLIHLGKHQEGGVSGLTSRIPPYLLTCLSEREVRAAVVLCERLHTGKDLDADDDAGALLRHAAAGATSNAYRRRLRAQSVLWALRKGDWRRFVRRLRQRPASRRKSVRPSVGGSFSKPT